jgi:glycine/D-amino acid oxidase-like deaminating enzyme
VPLAGLTRQALPAALAGARPVPYWLDQPGRPPPEPPLNRATAAGLAVVGGGFTGLWTALLAKERDPAADVVLLEGRSVGWAASGRNGGFCAASLTHGLANGRARFPAEIAERASVGWRNRQGLADGGNHFHYYRLTADNRILWGGYDAVYYNGGRIRAARDANPATFARLAGHFFRTFPQLAGLYFTHAWGGVVDTCSRFCVFTGTAHGGRLAYAAGYTGLGVGAARFGANTMLDLLHGEQTERTSLAMMRTRPVPFPPEPARSAVIQLTRASIARADRNVGRRDLWLRTLDRLGLGYDS